MYSKRSTRKSLSLRAPSRRAARALITSTEEASPRENRASRKPLPAPPAIITQRSPTVCLHEPCRRSDDTQSRTSLASLNCSLILGNFSRNWRHSSSGVISMGLGNLRISKLSPTLTHLLADPSRLSKGITHSQPPSKMWWQVPAYHRRGALGTPFGRVRSSYGFTSIMCVNRQRVCSRTRGGLSRRFHWRASTCPPPDASATNLARMVSPFSVVRVTPCASVSTFLTRVLYLTVAPWWMAV